MFESTKLTEAGGVCSGLSGEPMLLRCLAFCCSCASSTSGYRQVLSVCDHCRCINKAQYRFRLRRIQ